MSKVNHELGNMIYNLEQRKKLAKVDFTQKAVVEVLGYLKELEQKYQRVQELENEILELQKELQVYKRALDIGSELALTQEIEDEDMYDVIREYMPDDEYGITSVGIRNYSLNIARQELKGESDDQAGIY